MKKYTFEDIEKAGLLIYSYIRGSHAYGLAKPDGTSDIDTGAIYLAPAEQLLGLGLDYQEQITSEKNDDTWIELTKFMHLLLKSNPTVLEALFIPDRCITYEHPIMTEIKKHRDKFITKEDIGDKYATKIDPTFGGMLSLNRLSQSPSGYNSSTLGYNCTAFGDDTLASGKNTIANGRSQHVFGEYNIADENTSSSTRSKNAVIVGNGTDGARANAHTLDWNGNAEYAGDIKANACGGEAPISLKETNDLAVEDKARIDTLETLGLVLLDGTINATFEVEDPEPAETSEDEEYYPYNNF